MASGVSACLLCCAACSRPIKTFAGVLLAHQAKGNVFARRLLGLFGVLEDIPGHAPCACILVQPLSLRHILLEVGDSWPWLHMLAVSGETSLLKSYDASDQQFAPA